MIRVKCEETSPILQREAQIARYVERAKTVEIALNQADAVEVAIDHREIDRVGLLRVTRGWMLIGPVKVELALRRLAA